MKITVEVPNEHLCWKKSIEFLMKILVEIPEQTNKSKIPVYPPNQINPKS